MSARCDLVLWMQCYWLFVWALGTMLGVATAGYDLPPLSLIGAGLCLFCGVAWWWRWGTRCVFVVLLLFAAFYGSYNVATRQQEQLSVNQLQEKQGQYLVLRGRWQNHPHPRKTGFAATHQNSGKPYLQSSMQAVLLVEAWQFSRAGEEWQHLPAEARVWVNWRGSEGPLLGTEVEVRGKLRATDRVSPFGIYCQRRGIFQSVQADEVRQLAGDSSADHGNTASGHGNTASGHGNTAPGHGNTAPGHGNTASEHWRIVAKVARWRQFCIETTLRNLPDDASALLLAMALGESSRLDPQILQQFRSAGVGHVMAASGLHLGLVYGAIVGLLRMLGVAKRRGLGLVVGGVWLYAALVGFTPSITRALLMCWFSLLAVACGRPGDLGRALALALVLALWLDPSQLSEVGFQLSYAAVLGIVMWQGAVERVGHYAAVRLGIYFWPGVRQVGASLALTVAVSLWVAPMLLFYFGEVSWITAVANLVVLPPLEIALGAGLGAWALSALSGFLPLVWIEIVVGWLTAPLWWVCVGTERLAVRMVACLSSWAEPWQCSPSVSALTTYYAVMLALWLVAWWGKIVSPGGKMDSPPAL